MNKQRYLRLQLKLSIVIASLIHRGCLPWTSPSAPNKRSRKNQVKRPSRLYYTENVTSNNNQFSFESSKNLNETDPDFLYVDDDSAFGFEGKSIAASRTQTRNAYSNNSPAHHAIEQVHALLDLYELSNSVSSVIVVEALEGVVRKIFQDKDHLYGKDVLEQLEAVTFRALESQIRLQDDNICMRALWRMYRQRYENNSHQYLEKATAFLMRWSSAVSSYYDDEETLLLKVPDDCIRDIFAFAATKSLNLTSNLWEMYRTIRQHSTDEALLRDVQTDALHILTTSFDTAWNGHQYQLLVDLTRQYQATNNTLYHIRDEEFKLALSTAAQAGEAQQATWLFRKLYHRLQSSDTEKRQLWRLLLKSYGQSSQDGALTYMEQLIRSRPETQHRELYNIVLEARSNQRGPGSGFRAKAFLEEMEELSKANTTSAALLPDIESLYHCVEAYLREEPFTFQNILDADQLARRIVTSYNLTSDGSLNHEQEPIFGRILQAYASMISSTSNNSNIPKAVTKASEDLFRFYLVQHRDGRVLETPKPDRHLEYMLQILNHHADKSKYHAETCFEFFRLFENLSQSGKADARPYSNSINVYYLLDTLAKSQQPGYGDHCERIFGLMIRRDKAIDASSLKHMLHCVVQCHRQDQNHKQAENLLELYRYLYQLDATSC